MHENEHAEIEAADDSTLVESAIRRDAAAFGRLYDMHVDRVYRHVYYRVGNVADAEDLTQRVFLKAWEAIGRYRKTASPFVAWLMTISHNVVVDFYRTKKDNSYLEAEVTVAGSAPNSETVVEARFEQQRLRRAILQLRGDEQQVVLLRFAEDFQFKEIAPLLNKSEGALRVILHRALVKLRDILEREKD